jgi:hypothetical protein
MPPTVKTMKMASAARWRRSRCFMMRSCDGGGVSSCEADLVVWPGTAAHRFPGVPMDSHAVPTVQRRAASSWSMRELAMAR